MLQKSIHFEEEDFAKTSHVNMFCDWPHLYPEPSDDFGYVKQVYDARSYCLRCDTGRRQIAPFRVRREPSWGRRKAMRLNWVRSEIFVRPELYEKVFAPRGVGYWPVLKRGGKELESVVQLRVDTIAEKEAEPMDGFNAVYCTVCGSKRYRGTLLDFAPRPTQIPDAPVFRVREEFGSGGETAQPIIVAKEVYQELTRPKVHGLGFHPLLPEGEDRPLRVEAK